MAELIVSCPNCSARYNVAKYDSGTKFKCKSCGKFLIVPDKPEDEIDGPPLMDEVEELPARGGGGGGRGGRGGGRAGGRGGRGGRRGGTRARAGGARGGGRGGRRDDYDDEDDDRQPLRTKKGPNWALIIGAGAAVLLIIIVGVVAMSNRMAQEAEIERQRRADEKAERDKYKDGGLEAKDAASDDKGRKHLKYNSSKKDKTKAGEMVDKEKGLMKELEDDKEAAGEETERTKWKNDDQKAKVQRWKVRTALLRIPSSGNAETAKNALNQFKQVFGDPGAEREALAPLDGIGKDVIPAIANFMTKDINHMQEQGAMMGSQLFNLLQQKCVEHFNYECEFQYGMFESPEERWKAIIAVKMKCIENGYEMIEKGKK
ncbi:MAG: zinc ribbon domain-containing protein [Planctomycetota bacterium]|jgi:hypothetical protein